MNRVLVRSILLAIAAGLLVAGAIWLRSRPQGLPLADFPAVDSKGYIAALKETGSTYRLVSIDPKGAVSELAGGEEADDREIVWKRDGRRVLFVSNRAPNGSYQIFEWLPDRDNDATQLTPSGAGRQNPWFTLGGRAFMYSSQGDILSTTYPKLVTSRVMPPSEEQSTEGESGDHVHQPGETHNPITVAWNIVSKALEGEAFTAGYLDRSGKYFAGSYATNRGQAFVIQDMEPADEKDALAMAPVAGETIDIAMHPTAPQAVVAVINFRYPILSAIRKEKLKPDGSVTRDFVHAVFIAGLKEAKLTPIFFSQDGNQFMESPAISPDGTKVALVAKQKSGEKTTTIGLLIAPIERGGVGKADIVASGNVSEPSWSPDGEYLAFIKDGDIYTVQQSGGGEKNITQGKGKFRTPLFSPMN
ncbi:MAG: TolB family protein [Fimbriimonadales bacterium]